MRSCCCTRRVCVGAAGATPILASALSRVTGCRAGHNTMAAIANAATPVPATMARPDQRGRRSSAFRRLDALLQTRQLQAFQRRHARRGSEQQIGAVLHVGSLRIEFAHQPACIDPACAVQAERHDRRAADHEQRQRRAGASEPPCQRQRNRQPGQAKQRGIETTAQARIAQGLAKDGRGVHGATRCREPLAIQRSSRNSSAISAQQPRLQVARRLRKHRAAGRGRVIAGEHARRRRPRRHRTGCADAAGKSASSNAGSACGVSARVRRISRPLP